MKDAIFEQYYLMPFRLDRQVRYLIWYMGAPDEFLLDASRCIPSFADRRQATQYAARLGIELKEELFSFHDLDIVQRWLRKPESGKVDCPEFLRAWNLFSDFATTVNGRISHIDWNRLKKIYDKLFWGNNLPAMTPPRRSYEPIWTPVEIKRMRRVMRRGLRLFRAHVRSVPDTGAS